MPLSIHPQPALPASNAEEMPGPPDASPSQDDEVVDGSHAAPALRVGLALGAGGLRGVAHIGVLGVFEEAGIPIDLLAGTSAGAIVGALHACGWSAAKMRDLVLHLKPEDVFDSNLRPLPLAKMAAKSLLDQLHLPSGWLGRVPRGVVPGRKLSWKLHQWTNGTRLDQLPTPFVAIATALETGQRALFGPPQLGSLVNQLDVPSIAFGGVPVALAARASSSIPGVFEPVAHGGSTLVDGGLVDTVPADVLKALGANVVIAVALGLRGNQPAVLDDVVQVVDQSLGVMVNARSRTDAERCADVVIAPAVPGLDLTDFSALQQTIEAGAAAARDALPAIRELLGERPPTT